ncbi:MAG TPA: PEP-CTERM sorting domain-containing protein [Coleofasciculaceae cyanobacterium]|jgi:hypothetical protein
MSKLKKLSMAVAGAAFVSLGAAYVNPSAANAAIVAVGDSGSWTTGSNTLANQGFNMVTLPKSSATELSSFSTLGSPFGNLNFSSPVEKRVIGSSWNTWSNGYTGEVYYNKGASTLEIALPPDIVAFDLYVEPEVFDFFEIAVTAMNGVTSTATLSQRVTGDSGAKYFGFYATGGDLIKSITLIDKSGGAANGFSIAQLRVSPVPEPFTIGGSLLAVCFGWGMRKKLASSKDASIKN